MRSKGYFPFFSVVLSLLIILGGLIIKMECVRLGYEVVKIRHLKKIAGDDRAHLELGYQKLIRPERLDHIGTMRLSLVRAQKNQVVLMAARGGIAVRQ